MSLIPPGSRIGRFEVAGVLGEGAMGVVYLGHDPQIERPVAIKTLRTHVGGSSDEDLKERFLKEAKLAGRLQHPNVVTIYEAGQDEGVPYIAMEYVDGEPLTRVLRSSEFTLRERVEVVREVALALEHAHSRGVLHRDVKPANILLTRDRRVKVADFGIGKLLSGSGDLTRTGQMIGSPAYMSPEQVRGEKLDGRSDFFSLGVVFYELLTGVRPFPGDSITTLVYQILHTEPRDPLAVRANLPPAAREVFARLLAKSADKRPADAPDFLRETRKIMDQIGEAEQTVPFSLPAAPAGAGMAAAAATAAARAAAAAATTPPATASSLVVSPGGPQVPVPVSGSPRGGVLYLFGVAAVLFALAIFVLVLRRARSAAELVASAPTPAGASASSTAPNAASLAPAATAVPANAVPAEVPTVGPLPTAGPRNAADAVVGAPRYTGASPAPAPTRVPRVAPTSPRVAPAAVATSPDEPSAIAEQHGPRDVADNVYRTRRYGKFGVSPDQARMYVDGRYVGIADDWDDRGGGKKFEFHREGTHRVRFELPGYRTLNVDVIVSSGADDDTADVGDELKRESRVPFPKLSSPDGHTVGPVIFEVEPADATVSENGRTLGPASSFGPSSPLRLSGPAVHDLVVAAPGRKSKTLRILVAGNADSNEAKMKVELKKE
jgi:predicted Ser/Thr protein kinase